MHRSRALAIFAAVVCSACVPLPQHRYVADAAGGALVYSSCPANKHVPVGVAFERGGVRVEVSLDPDYIEARFDVPDGKTVALRNGSVKFGRDPTQLTHESTFPDVSLDNYARDAVQKESLPIDTPLVGARLVVDGYSWDRHYWLGTSLDTGSADDIWIALPAFTINGTPADLAPIHFHRRRMIVMALINC